MLTFHVRKQETYTTRYRYNHGRTDFAEYKLKLMDKFKFKYSENMSEFDILAVETKWHNKLCKEVVLTPLELLEKKRAKLLELMLLTDSVVCHVPMSSLQIKQHEEFLRCFPDEAALLENPNQEKLL
jgi:hypothetical protein